ncbi:hypothetical protein UFOVP207_28 [uncultured Caudovirales phage]|uniref:Uncharacterized protein n=1 Tax=uncultured Caudovirales phage TaxID=2100421 RepID=A0A6J7WJ68_9CAUD|nr:hypothetical protein UFOVP207_28 [uncultured Caudovirales phage]
MKESIEKLIYCIPEYDVILSGKSHEIFSHYYNVKDAFGFVKKDGELYLIDEFLNEIKLEQRKKIFKQFN